MIYMEKLTGLPKNKTFKTLNIEEINEVILMVFRQLIDRMQKNELPFITIDQLMLLRHEIKKNPIKGEL